MSKIFLLFLPSRGVEMKLIKCQNKDSETNHYCFKTFKEKEGTIIGSKTVCQNCYKSIIYWRKHNGRTK